MGVPLQAPSAHVDIDEVALPDWYPDPQVPGQLRYWNGLVWTADTAPAVAAPAPSTSSRTTWTVVIVSVAAGVSLLLVAAKVLGLSIGVTSFHTSDTTIYGFAYSQSVRSDLASVNQAAQGLHPVCDKGGQLQGCFVADQQMLAALDAAVTDLNGLDVPKEYAAAHGDLLAGLALDIDAFRLRNAAIAEVSNGKWQRSNREIRRAQTLINHALAEYPRGTVLDNG